MPDPITKHPDFDASLRLLVEVERYSLSDISLMFGCSRERVRQWCGKRGIIHPDGKLCRGMNAYRAWDDEKNRFSPVSRGEWNRLRHAKRVSDRKSLLQERWHRKRGQFIVAAQKLRFELGRDPTNQELVKNVLGKETSSNVAGSTLAAWWGGTGSTKKKYQALVTALREAGVVVSRIRRRGSVAIEHCKRGHPKAGNTYPNGGCSVCGAWYAQIKKARRKGLPLPTEPIEPGFEKK